MIREFTHIDLRDRNSFGVEQRAARLVEFETADDLRELFRGGIPEQWYVLSGGNNILFTRDYDGVLITPVGRRITPLLDDGEADLLPPDVQSEDAGGLNENQNVPSAQASGMLSAIWLLIAQEKQYILESAIPADDKETGYKMLTEIYKALKDKNFDVANSLVNGYNYYILYNNAISPGVQTLFENIESFEGAV